MARSAATATEGDAAAITTMTPTAKRSHPNVTLAVLALGGMSYAMLSSLVVPALPTMQHDLHTTETGIAWLLTGYLLAASVGTSIIGRLGDMYGKERLLLWTLGVLAAGTVLAAASSSLIPIIIGRVIQGVGGGIFPLAFGIVRDEFPREQVAGAIGLLSAILGVGGGIGIVLAGVIIQHLSYHWLFWIPLVADRDRRSRDLAIRARVAGPRAREDQLAGRRPDDDRHLGRPARDQRDDDLGLGGPEDDPPDVRRVRLRRRSGSPSRPAAGTRWST